MLAGYAAVRAAEAAIALKAPVEVEIAVESARAHGVVDAREEEARRHPTARIVAGCATKPDMPLVLEVTARLELADTARWHFWD